MTFIPHPFVDKLYDVSIETSYKHTSWAMDPGSFESLPPLHVFGHAVRSIQGLYIRTRHRKLNRGT